VPLTPSGVTRPMWSERFSRDATDNVVDHVRP